MLTYTLASLSDLEAFYQQQLLSGELSDAYLDKLTKELQETDERLNCLKEEERLKKEHVKTEAESDRLEAERVRDIIMQEGLKVNEDETSEYDEENPENE
jgi:hypothetical protein